MKAITTKEFLIRVTEVNFQFKIYNESLAIKYEYSTNMAFTIFHLTKYKSGGCHYKIGSGLKFWFRFEFGSIKIPRLTETYPRSSFPASPRSDFPPKKKTIRSFLRHAPALLFVTHFRKGSIWSSTRNLKQVISESYRDSGTWLENKEEYYVDKVFA